MIIIKNNRKKIIMILISIILLFLIIIASISIFQDNKKEKELEQLKQVVAQYSSIEDFKSIQEVALYLDCKLISIEESKQENIKYNVNLSLKITPEEEGAEQYYEKLVQYSAHALEYNNFFIVDKDKNIIVLVLCNKEKNLVSNYYINEEENYFKTRETQKQMNNSVKIESIEVDVQSEVLKNILKNEWRVLNEIGTKESSFNGYDIYFDEGFEIKKINNKVFNIVFNEKYEKNIVNNLNTKSTKEEIEEILGKPQFELSDLIGYKTKNMYIFFYKNQISIYKIEDYNTDKIVEFIEQYNTEKNLEKLINQVKEVWKDYDIYEYGNNYILLQYTTKGIAFKYGIDNNNGIYLYNNYTGNISKTEKLDVIIKNKLQLPQNVFYEDIDLTFKNEIKRLETQYDTTENNNKSSSIITNTSSKFKTVKTKKNDGYEIKFISINKQYPNSELKEVINKGLWFNDSIFIYSIKDRGIFYYNAVERTYGTIVNGKQEFNLYYLENEILYYDDTSVKVEI